MPIPTYEQMLRPLLSVAASQDITRKDASVLMADQFNLTSDEREARIPSGQSTYIRNRVGWAMTFLTKGSLIEKVAPRTYRITDRGRAFLAQHPHDIKERELRALPGWRAAWGHTDDDAPETDGHEPPENHTTPLEALDNAVTTLNADLKDRLLTAILEQSPAFFEHLVLDVLIAMGYGGSRADAAQHLGRANDEGVDGRVNQDPLGLDQIVVQAKRYAPDRAIDRQTIQAFVGSMTGQGVTKGIFITTSKFNANAKEFVQRGYNVKVVLVDGDELLNLMLRHHIGVRVERQVEVLDFDQNYFHDED
ncbi:MAG: restriction endonuclease [Vicinamibacterales bacterium]